MSWYQTVFEMIDMRSFSNLWYWIALAVLWSTASHWILGVPFDMVQRAGRQGGQAEEDLADLVRINMNRIFFVVAKSGVLMTAVVTGALTSLAILGFLYDFEFAQAVFFLGAPLAVIGVMNLKTARKIQDADASGATLRKMMTRHRLYVQILGVVSIFVTALWGMAQNILVTGPL